MKKVSAVKLAKLLNGLDLNETVLARQESIRVGKSEYKRIFSSDFFLNDESRALPVVKALIENYFASYAGQFQYCLDYNIESREFSLTVRVKQRLVKKKTAIAA